MKSNKCLFSKAIFKSNIIRFLPFAAPLLIAELIIFPINIFNNYSPKSRLGLSDFATTSAASDAFTFIFAAVMALLTFSYLFKAPRCNAVHAFPVGRKALFVTNFLSAYVLLVVPKLLGFAAGIPFLFMFGTEAPKMIILQIASIFGVSFVMLAIAVLAIMLSGNFFSGAVIYFILNFVYVAARGVISFAEGSFGYGLDQSFLDINAGSYLSPFTKLFLGKGLLDDILNNNIEETLSGYYKSLIILVAAAVIICVASFLLYKIRKLECAGDMVAYKAEIPVLSITVSLLGGAYVALFFNGIFMFEDLITPIIFFAVSSFIFYFAAQMILRKRAKVFQIKQLILWAVTCAVGLGAISGIVVFATNYIPKEAKSVEISSTYEIELTSKEDIDKVRELHALLIEDAKATATNHTLPNNYYAEDSNSDVFVTIIYDGKTARNYTVRKKSEKIVSLLDELEKSHPPVTVFEKLKELDYTVKNGKAEFYFYVNDEMPDDASFTGEKLKKAFAFCEKKNRELADGYTSSAAAGNYGYSVNVVFSCSLNDAGDVEKLEELNYYRDPTGASIQYSYPNYYDDYLADVDMPSKTDFEIDITFDGGKELYNEIKDGLE